MLRIFVWFCFILLLFSSFSLNLWCPLRFFWRLQCFSFPFISLEYLSIQIVETVTTSLLTEQQICHGALSPSGQHPGVSCSPHGWCPHRGQVDRPPKPSLYNEWFALGVLWKSLIVSFRIGAVCVFCLKQLSVSYQLTVEK